MQDYGTGNKAKDIFLQGGDISVASALFSAGDIMGAGPTWTSLGYTAKDQGGVLSDKPPTFKDVKVTGYNDPIKRRAGDREVKLKVLLVQTTLANLKLAIGAADADLVPQTLAATTAITAAVHASGVITVTSTAHGCVPGDVVEINSVVGMTDINGRWVLLTGSGNTMTFAKTTAQTYTSGGTVAKVTVPTALLGGKSQDSPQRTWKYTVKNDDDATRGKCIYIPAGKAVSAVEVKFADDNETGVLLEIDAYEVQGAVTLGAAGPSMLGFRYAITEGSY
jgi:hypothetical protein